jgi:hypothetical protein
MLSQYDSFSIVFLSPCVISSLIVLGEKSVFCNMLGDFNTLLTIRLTDFICAP